MSQQYQNQYQKHLKKLKELQDYQTAMRRQQQRIVVVQQAPVTSGASQGPPEQRQPPVDRRQQELERRQQFAQISQTRRQHLEDLRQQELARQREVARQQYMFHAARQAQIAQTKRHPICAVPVDHQLPWSSKDSPSSSIDQRLPVSSTDTRSPGIGAVYTDQRPLSSIDTRPSAVSVDTRSPNMGALGNDVHTYTQFFKQYVPKVAPHFKDLVTRGELMFTVRKFMRATERVLCAEPCFCRAAVQQIVGPVNEDQSMSIMDAADMAPWPLYDPDLGPLIDIRTLLVRCIDYAFDHDELKTLHDTLHEVGTTCIQGESHRLLFQYMAWLKLY